jgi:hypothetical protein
MDAQGLHVIGLGIKYRGFGYKISCPAGIFTAELTALFVTLRHIGEMLDFDRQLEFS